LELAIVQHDPALGPALQHHVNNPLPVRYSSFLGRGEEIADIHDRLSRYRLVTITGLGGIGKSSLAVEAVRGLEEDVDLAYVDVESALPGDVAVTTARALGLQPRSEDDAEALISRAAAKTSLMLLLDGCEDVVAAVARMSDRLLRASPELRILVTSREALNLSGESLLILGPLEHSSRSPATELFLDRLGVRVADQEQQAAVAAICDRLDGIPLAIELAAARARSVPLSRVAALLDRQIDFLADRRRPDDRHGSLRAALDSSYLALTEDRRRALRSLAIFRSGFETDAAGYVLDVEDADVILGDLVSTSLLLEPSPTGRYHMLEPVRQYAWSLAEAEDEITELANRHADWYVQFARYCGVHQRTAAQITVYERAAAEHGELLAAVRWSLSGDGSHAVAIIAALGRLWYSVGMDQQLRVLMLAAVQHADVKPSSDLAVAMSHTGFAWYFEDADPHALSLVEQAVKMARDVGDDGAVGTTLTRLAGVVSEGLDDGDTGLELELEGYELLHQSRHPDAEYEAYNLAQHLAGVGRLEEASRLLGEFIERASTNGLPTYEATALFGHYLIAQGQLVEGIEASERGVEMLERLGRYHTLIAQTYFLGLAYSLSERHDEAIAMLHRSAACWDHFGREVPENWRPPLDVARARATSPDPDATTAAIRSWIESTLRGMESQRITDGQNPASPTMPSELLLIAHPASAVIDDPPTAALVGASALRLMTDDEFKGWKGAGEIDRLRNHLEQLPAPAAPVLTTQQDLLVLLAETFGASHLPSPSQPPPRPRDR
jgi:predicted ATPase